MTEGSLYFKRFVKECKRISRHIRFKRIKMGFYRIYYKDAYLHECYKDMPYKGYNIETYNHQLESKEFFQEYEDDVDTVRKVKNFVEGYVDSMDKIKKRVYMFKNDDEFYQNAKNAYKQVVIK